jgi:hypothetical protein
MAIFSTIITKYIGGIWGDRRFGMVIEFIIIRGIIIILWIRRIG